MRLHILSFGCALAVVLGLGVSPPHARAGAIALDLVPRSQHTSCASRAEVACSAFEVRGATARGYDLYLVAISRTIHDRFPVAAEFGLTYDLGIEVFSWTGCGTITQGSARWPRTGSGAGVTVQGPDCTGSESFAGTQRVLGSFYVYAYSEGQFRIGTHPLTERTVVYTCEGTSSLPWDEETLWNAVNLPDPRGRVAFSDDRTVRGSNPCDPDEFISGGNRILGISAASGSDIIVISQGVSDAKALDASRYFFDVSPMGYRWPAPIEVREVGYQTLELRMNASLDPGTYVLYSPLGVLYEFTAGPFTLRSANIGEDLETVSAVFSRPLGSGGDAVTGYRLARLDGLVAEVVEAVEVDGNRANLRLAEPLAPGVDYRLVVSEMEDDQGTPISPHQVRILHAEPTLVETTTWGRIKLQFRPDPEPGP